MTGNPDDIVGTFFAQASCPTQSQIDTLVKTLGIPIMVLARDANGSGFAVGMIRVERTRSGFDFTDEEGVRPVCGFVAWDREGAPQDIVGWSPRDAWTGRWLNRAIVLGEHMLDEYRLGEPLRAFLDVGSWLQAERDGVVILDRRSAWWLLDGIALEAESLADRAALRKALTPPAPTISVRGAAAKQERAAA